MTTSAIRHSDGLFAPCPIICLDRLYDFPIFHCHYDARIATKVPRHCGNDCSELLEVNRIGSRQR